jgi:Fe-S cluster biogenesis protein NfuA
MKGMRVLSLLLCTALATLAPAGAAPASGTAGAAPELSRLEVIRAGHHPGFDRVVLEFDGPVPVSQIRYVDTLIGDPSGLPVPVPGRAVLRVVLRGAEAHDEFGDRASQRNTFPLPNVMSALQAGDFEGVVTYGVGLAARRPFHTFTLTNPSRLVIDIKSDFRTVFKRVYFVNEQRVAANTPPFVTPVLRRVLPLTPATGLMDRLFAGPTPPEAETGLQPPTFPSLTARSGATGFTGLSIRDGIARVRLTGGCSSGGSTVTIADEIMPTLRQFDTVDYVKIYDPSGRTERPTGRTDSIPECLEP